MAQWLPSMPSDRLHPIGMTLNRLEWDDTHDRAAMCTNCVASPHQTSTVGIVRYVCLGHPDAGLPQAIIAGYGSTTSARV